MTSASRDPSGEMTTLFGSKVVNELPGGAEMLNRIFPDGPDLSGDCRETEKVKATPRSAASSQGMIDPIRPNDGFRTADGLAMAGVGPDPAIPAV